MTEEIRDIGDVLPSGELIRAEDCLLQTMIIHGIADSYTGEYGEMLIASVTLNDEMANVGFGGEVVRRQLRTLAERDAFPVRAMLVKQVSKSVDPNSERPYEFYQLVSPENAPAT